MGHHTGNGPWCPYQGHFTTWEEKIQITRLAAPAALRGWVSGRGPKAGQPNKGWSKGETRSCQVGYRSGER